MCDVPVRGRNETEFYDLHSFAAAPHGPSEFIDRFPIDPHPAGPVLRSETVRLTPKRTFPLILNLPKEP